MKQPRDKFQHNPTVANTVANISASSLAIIPKGMTAMEADKKILGERIKIVRNLSNMTQDELAQRLFISRTCLSNYEAGRRNPSLQFLQQLSELLAINIDFLLGNENETSESFKLQQHYNELRHYLTKDGHLDLSLDSPLIKIMTIEFYLFIRNKYTVNTENAK